MSAHLNRQISVEIAPGARSAIKTAAALSTDGLETGGILLGRDLNAEGLIEVLRAAGPGPHAIRTPSFFLRDLHYTRRLARLAYEREGLQWVGDWHTHPSGPCCPSDFDLEIYTRHLADDELGFTAFVGTIVTPGRDNSWKKCRLNAAPYSLPSSEISWSHEC